MSSSYRKPTRVRSAVAGACTAACLLSASAGPAFAAQTYVQPQAELRVENNDNFDLLPQGSPDSDVYGYIADLQALIGIATPRSDTSLRPRIRLQEYPDRDDIEKFEAFLDLRSNYQWERSDLLTIARYSRQDSYNADRQSGEFDPLDPQDPDALDSSQKLVGETRTRVELRPTFTHSLTERTRLGLAAQYQAVRYDADSAADEQTDYDYLLGEGFVSWALNPRSDVSVGAYAAKYEATDDSTETDTIGGSVGYSYRWSELAGLETELFYEENDITDFVPVTTEETTSGWGGTVTAYWTGEVSETRFSAGRTFAPTGSGGKSEVDQFRLQYDRDLSERLSFLGAARYQQRNSLGTAGSSDDRDFARVDLSLKWFFEPTWFVQGGYSYIWEDRESASGSADNNKLFLSVGYKALARQRR
jgi:hypothetical protein